MLKISATITNLNYESTLKALFPLISDKLSGLNSSNIAIQAVQQLGDTTLPVAVEVLRRVPNETKNEILVSAVNIYSSVLTEKLNELLKSKVGRSVTIGGLSATQRGNAIQLFVYQVKADYKTLLSSAFVRSLLTKHLGGMAEFINKLGRMAFLVLSAETLEKMILDFALQGENKQKVLSAIQKAIDGYGVKLRLSTLQIEQSSAATPVATSHKPSFKLTEQQEQALIAAVTGYLKEIV